MLALPMEFTTVDGMPAVTQEIQYSCGARVKRVYQAGELIDAIWINPIKAIRVKPEDVIEHREVELMNHYYRNK